MESHRLFVCSFFLVFLGSGGRVSYIEEKNEFGAVRFVRHIYSFLLSHLNILARISLDINHEICAGHIA